MRATRRLMLIAQTALLSVNALAGDKIFIFATSQMDKAAQARHGKDMGDQMRGPLEDLVLAEVRGQLPCLDHLTSGDAGNLMNLQRMRDLLGAGADEEALAAVAGAVGAKYFVRLKWIMTGNNVTIDGNVFNVPAGKVVVRQSAQFPYNEDAGDEMIKFAQQLAASVAGSLPKCPPKGWKGTVSFKEEFIETGSRSNHPYEHTRTQEGVCIVEAGKNTARCKSSVSSRTKETCPTGKACGGTITGNDEGMPYVTVDVADGKVKIQITSYSIPATSYSEFLGTTNNDLRAGMGGYLFDAPATPDQKSQSGSKTVELVKTDKVTFTYKFNWSLTRDW